MVNFKDVLEQTGQSCGALWCDEAVYALAREIQMLRPGKDRFIFEFSTSHATDREYI